MRITKLKDFRRCMYVPPPPIEGMGLYFRFIATPVVSMIDYIKLSCTSTDSCQKALSVSEEKYIMVPHLREAHVKNDIPYWMFNFLRPWWSD